MRILARFARLVLVTAWSVSVATTALLEFLELPPAPDSEDEFFEVEEPGTTSVPAGQPPRSEQSPAPPPAPPRSVREVPPSTSATEATTPTSWECPLCDGQMTTRRAGRGGVFWSCVTYPQCKGTRQWKDPQVAGPVGLVRARWGIAPPPRAKAKPRTKGAAKAKPQARRPEEPAEEPEPGPQ